MMESLTFIDDLVAKFNVANMYFNTIHENKILAKCFEIQ